MPDCKRDNAVIVQLTAMTNVPEEWLCLVAYILPTDIQLEKFDAGYGMCFRL